MKKKIAFIGLGDVGSRYSSGISDNGADVKGFDLRFGQPVFKEYEERITEHGVAMAKDQRDVIEGSDIILVPTSCLGAAGQIKRLVFDPLVHPNEGMGNLPVLVRVETVR